MHKWMYFSVMQFTHLSQHNGAWSKKQKFKFRQNCFANLVSIKKISIGHKGGLL